MSESFLDQIVAVKREKVEQLKAVTDPAALKERALAVRQTAADHQFMAALGRKDRTNIIAEIKRASPSKGVINNRIDVVRMAERYRDGGAAAISVLTEEDFFKGSLNDLIAVSNAVDLPILRKDFVVDEFQVYESAAAGSDAILLIVAALDETQLADLYHLATNELMIDAIVEVHTPYELETAARIGANIIGVNNRDLKTLEVSLDLSRSLIVVRPAGALMIAESGVSDKAEIEELRSLGYDGFLIGETLMRTGDARELLREWV